MSGGDGIGMRVPDNMDYRPMVNDTLNELVLNPMLTEVERNGILRVIRELTLRCELVSSYCRSEILFKNFAAFVLKFNSIFKQKNSWKPCGVS